MLFPAGYFQNLKMMKVNHPILWFVIHLIFINFILGLIGLKYLVSIICINLLILSYFILGYYIIKLDIKLEESYKLLFNPFRYVFLFLLLVYILYNAKFFGGILLFPLSFVFSSLVNFSKILIFLRC